jgi:hypothetical protein
MKRVICSAAGIALMAGLALSASALDPSTAGGVWLFNEGAGTTAGDSSGNGNTGTFDGGVEWTDGPTADSGTAVLLDGSGFVGVPDSDSIDLGSAGTVVFWVRSDKEMLDMWADRQVVVGKHYLEYEIGIYLDGQIHTYSSNLGGDYDEGILVSFADTHPDGDADWGVGKWHHVAWTLDGTHEVAYINGVMMGEFDKPNAGTAGGDHPLEIGRRTEGGLNVTGAIDDVGIFGVALGPDDIMAIYEDGLGLAMGIAAVEPAGKLTSMWGDLKRQQ